MRVETERALRDQRLSAEAELLSALCKNYAARVIQRAYRAYIAIPHAATREKTKVKKTERSGGGERLGKTGDKARGVVSSKSANSKVFKGDKKGPASGDSENGKARSLSSFAGKLPLKSALKKT